MKTFRIVYTETDLRGGNMVDVECGTKWLDEAEFSLYAHLMHKRNAKVVAR